MGSKGGARPPRRDNLRGVKASRVAKIVALSASVSLLGCSVLDPSLIAVDAGSVDSGPGDAGVDADSGATVMDGCEDGSRRPPPRPSGPDGDGPEIVFGLKEVRLIQMGDAWRDIGFNLDGLCSVPPAPIVECLPPAYPDAEPLIDGNQGVDNAFGAELTPLIDLVFPDLADAARESAEEGVGVVLFRIRGWNGEANDPRVDVTVAQSVAGTAGSAVDDTPPDVEFRDFVAYPPGGMEPLPPPMWDGHDWFWVRDEAFFMGDIEQPKVRDDNAYVADNQLVITLPARVEIVFANTENGLLVRLTDGIAVSTISEDRTRISPAMFGGRWSILDLLETARTVNVCDGSPEFNLLRNQLNTIADVRSEPGSGGEGVMCDAISVGVTFEGYRARLAGTTPGQIPPNTCE